MSPPTPTLGARLRDAREARGLTSSQLAELTRIKIQQIEGLERDDFSKIPAPMYVKGFIRILAQELALDAKPLLELYTAQTQTQPEAPVVRDTPRTRKPIAPPPPRPAPLPEPVDVAPESSLIPEAPPAVRRFSPPPRPPPPPPFKLPPLPAFLKDLRLLGPAILLLLLVAAFSLRSCGTSGDTETPELRQTLLEEPPPMFLELPRTLP